jgi:hypothetical protein
MLKKMLKLMKLSVDEEIDAYGDQGGEYVAAVRARSIPVLVKVDSKGAIIDSLIGINHTDRQFAEVCNG